MNKKKKGFLCLALCLILTVSFGMQGLRVNATNMSSITSDSIRNKQDQIKQAEKEREQMKSNLSNLEQIKKDLETQKTNLKNYVTQLDQNLSQIEQNIADLKNKITAKEEEIAKTQAELDAALEREENQKDAMIRRIRIMYEKGDSYILDMMLKAESFSDFLNRADFMDLIMAYDRQQWKDFMENRKYIELCKEELEAEKAILDEAKAGVEQEQTNMEALTRRTGISPLTNPILPTRNRPSRNTSSPLRIRMRRLQPWRLPLPQRKKRSWRPVVLC